MPHLCEPRHWPNLTAGRQTLLTALALHDGAFADATLAALAANPADVDQLVADGWIEEATPGQWQLVPAAPEVITLATWSMRREAHLALARQLGRNPQHGARAAAHYESGGQPDTAGRLWLATARLCCRHHQPAEAGKAFAEAIRLLPDGIPEDELVAAVHEFGACAALHRQSPDAIALLRAWRNRPDWAGRSLFQGHAGRVLADLLARDSRHVESAEARRDAARHFLPAGLGGDAAGELLAAATTLVWALRFSAARELADEAIALARQHRRPDLESQAMAALGLTLGMLGETAAGRATLEGALDVALAHRLTAQAANAYRLMGNVDDYASCYDDQTAFRKAISYCARHDQPTIADLCRGCLSYSLFRRGRWGEALKIARLVSRKPGVPESSRAAGIMVHGLIRIMRGELRPGVGLIEQGLLLGRSSGLGAVELYAWAALAAAHEISQRPDDAAPCYRRLMEFWLTTEDRHDVLPGFCAAVAFFAQRGDRTQAAEFALPLQRIAALTGSPEAIASAHCATAELKLLDGKPAEAIPALRAALQAFAAHNCCIELIRTRLRLGAALLAVDQPDEARVVMREARARAVRLGCRPLAALASHALTAGNPRRTKTGPSANLSPRQREVGVHLRAGHTNKEIAAALGLSVRTVDMHVAHLLARLDCRTRTEAAARLAD